LLDFRPDPPKEHSLSANILLVALAGADADGIADALAARQHKVITVAGVSAAGPALAGTELVIVAAGANPATAEGCRTLRKDAPAGLPILAVSQGHDVEERIALLEAGADDVLGQPFDARQLEALTDALLSRRQPASGEATPQSSGMHLPPGGVGTLICFGAAKGGVGTTLLAVNTAVALARRGLGVAIADLDLHHGQVAAHLDLPVRHSTVSLARDTHLQVSPTALADAAEQHDSGLLAYLAPTRPDEGSALEADDLLELVRAMRATHPLLIVDAGSVPGTRALSLLGLADKAVFVVTPEIPALRALTGTLAVMKDLGMEGEQNMFVLNHTAPGGQIGRSDIEQTLNVKVALEVPFDGPACQRAVNEGKPVVSESPKSQVSAAVERLASLLVAGALPAEAVTPASGRRLGGLLRRG
jgi:pilus assembly protein CpaE